MTASDAAKILGVSPTLIGDRVREGKIKAHKSPATRRAPQGEWIILETPEELLAKKDTLIKKPTQTLAGRVAQARATKAVPPAVTVGGVIALQRQIQRLEGKVDTILKAWGL